MFFSPVLARYVLTYFILNYIYTHSIYTVHEILHLCAFKTKATLLNLRERASKLVAFLFHEADSRLGVCLN